MNSAGHRQNMLNAGYDTVGIGVACSGARPDRSSSSATPTASSAPAEGRQAAQNATEGDPVPAGPTVAGIQTGDPVYCPGQTVGPNGAVTVDGGQYPYPYAVPAVPGEPIRSTAADPASGWPPRPTAPATGWPASDGSVTAHGDAADYGSMAGQPLAAPITHIVATPDGRGYWLVAADGGIFTFGDAGFYGSMGGLHLNAPVVDMAPDAGRQRLLAGGVATAASSPSATPRSTARWAASR